MAVSHIDLHTTTMTFQDASLVAQTVTGKRSLSGPNMSVDVKDRTTLEDANYKVKAPGLIDPGQYTLELYHDLTDAGQAAIRAALGARATREVVITLSDSSTITFDCFVSAVDGPGGAVSEDAVISITLEVTGAPVDA